MMQRERLRFARSSGLAMLCLILIFGVQVGLLAQDAAAPSSGTDANLPAVKSVSEAATPASSANPALANSANTSEITRHSISSSITLGAGDLIGISVYNVPELSTKARVGNAGDIYLPLIDYVHVSGLTIEQAQALIQKRLEDGGFVRNAHVAITVDESPSQSVTILGEVAKPGIYPVRSDRKLYDLISAAGGFTAAAGRRVSIIRQQDTPTAISIDLPKNLADNLQDDVEIFPGDTITVPRAPIVYVVGDVGRPTGLLIDNGTLTVLQALALAGGTNHTAKMGATRIIRKGPGGMMETKVPLKKMLEAKAPDITLQADDILFIPLSGARLAAGQAMQAGLSAATGIAVIAAHP
jgi:polysaccharide biosynthesis/export protein